MNNELEIYLVRHTEPLIETGVCYGQLDCALTDDYAQQLKKVCAYFNHKNITAIYSSPLQRCAQLAEDLALGAVSSVIYKDTLKEINFGDWEGMRWADISRKKIDEWNNNRLHFCFPNGETPAQFTKRVLAGYLPLQFSTAHVQTQKRAIVIVTHAGVIRTILGHTLHLSASDCLNIKIDKPSISLCSFNNGILESHLINISLNVNHS